MKRTISSAAHSAFKILAFAMCVIALCSFLASTLDSGRPRWELLPVLGFFGLLLVFTASRKTVQVDDRALYVSTFRRVTTIPLSDIESVSETIRLKDRFITIRFRQQTPVGRSIRFTPTLRFDYKTHPILSELQASVQNT